MKTKAKASAASARPKPDVRAHKKIAPAVAAEVLRDRRFAVVGLEDGPEAGFGAVTAEHLRAAGAFVLGVVFGHAEGAAYRDDLCHEVLRVPDPASDAGGFARELSHAVAKRGLHGIFAGSDKTAAALEQARSMLDVPIVGAPPPAMRSRLGAAGVLAAAGAGDLHAAPHAVPRFPAEDAAVALTFGFPMLVGGADGVFRRAFDAGEAAKAAVDVRVRGLGDPVYFRYDAARTVEIAAVIDTRGRVVAVAAARILSDDGRRRAWLAATCRPAAALAAVRRAALRMKGVGAVVFSGLLLGDDLQFTDVRPGLPQWLAAAAQGGVDLVAYAYRVAAGLPAPAAPDVAEGWLFSQTAEDVVVDAGRLVTIGRETQS